MVMERDRDGKEDGDVETEIAKRMEKEIRKSK
jgi:hypothetical protein